MTTLRPLEQAALCLSKAAELRLREFEAGWACFGFPRRLLFQYAAEKARGAGEPALAARIEAAKDERGQPELNLLYKVRSLIRARALPERRAAA